MLSCVPAAGFLVLVTVLSLGHLTLAASEFSTEFRTISSACVDLQVYIKGNYHYQMHFEPNRPSSVINNASN